MTTHVEGDRVVVTGSITGAIFPSKQAEVARRLELRGSAGSPYRVDGAIYARDLVAVGGGTLFAPVLVRGDASFTTEGKGGLHRALGGIHVSGNLSVKAAKRRREETFLARPDGAAMVVRGDIVADAILLEDTIAFGNIHARRVKLVRSVVLGQVIATEAAVVSASAVVSYEAPSIRFEGPCTMIFALGTSDEPPCFAPYSDGSGEIPPAVYFHPALQAAGVNDWLVTPSLYKPEALFKARLFPVDWIQANLSMQVEKIRNGKRVLDEVIVPRHVLSIGGRVLGLASLKEALDRTTRVLQAVLEYPHLHSSFREKYRKEWQTSPSSFVRWSLDAATQESAPKASA